MKRKFTCDVALFSLMSATICSAQEKPQWGNDVNVSPAAGEFYKDVRVSVAYNGDIYMGRLSAVGSSGPYQHWTVLKSMDNGATWSVFKESNLTSGTEPLKYTSFDMITAGDDAGSFRVFVARPYMDTVSKVVTMRATSYNSSGSPTNLDFDGESYTSYTAGRGFDYICWATDSRKPSMASAPFCISLVAAKASSPYDSLLVWTSPNGGSSFVYRELDTSGYYIKHVSATLATDSILSDYPRLGIAYEVFESFADTTGSIFARFIYADDGTDLIYSGPYQVGAAGSSYAHPAIAMSQVSGEGTGPGLDDYRTIISYEAYTAGQGLGVYYRATDNLFSAAPDFSGAAVVINAGPGNQRHPHLVFDPLYKNFIMTYYDEATGKLPYCIKGMATTLADPFTLFYPNYRDVTSIPAASIEPRVDMNISTATAVFAWNDAFKSMFDAENSSLSISESPLNIAGISAYPNPANNQLNLKITSGKRDEVSLRVLDLTGQVLIQRTMSLKEGSNQFILDVSGLPSGVCLLQVQGAHTATAAKVTIRH